MLIPPYAEIIFLSPDLESVARHTFQKLKLNLEDVLQQTLFDKQEVMSSLLHAIFFAMQTCAKVTVYGVIPSCDAASNTWRCKRSSYFEDSEPSHDQQTRTTSEEMIVLALEHAKLLTVERPKTMRNRHDEASNSTSGMHSQSPTICPGVDLQTADCDGQAGRGGVRQQQQRQRQQRVDNNDASEKCVCDVDNKCEGKCSRVASKPALFEDIKLVFTGSLLMSKATVQLHGNGNGCHLFNALTNELSAKHAWPTGSYREQRIDLECEWPGNTH